MKILFDIQEKYKELEIHICCEKKDEEAISIKNSIEKIFQTKITAYKNQRVKLIGITEIVRIYAEAKKVYVRTDKEIYEVKERLYSLEEVLCDKGFVRISNSEIVNVSKIEKLDMGYTGTIKIFMENKDETYVSRRYVSKIKEVLM